MPFKDKAAKREWARQDRLARPWRYAQYHENEQRSKEARDPSLAERRAERERARDRARVDRAAKEPRSIVCDLCRVVVCPAHPRQKRCRECGETERKRQAVESQRWAMRRKRTDPEASASLKAAKRRSRVRVAQRAREREVVDATAAILARSPRSQKAVQ